MRVVIRISFAALLATAALFVTTVLAVIIVTQLASGKLRLQHPAPGRTSNPGPVIAPGKAPLGFNAESQNGDLKLVWNRESAAVQTAISGLLTIQDGDTRTIILNSSQIRNGSILYAPASNQIQALSENS